MDLQHGLISGSQDKNQNKQLIERSMMLLVLLKEQISQAKAFLVNFSPDCHPLGSVKKIKVEVDKFLASSGTSQPSGPSNFPGLEASMAKLGFSGFKQHHSKGEERGGGKKFAKLSVEGSSVKRENKEWCRNKKRKGGEDLRA
ncbi:hypothetical protein MKW98_005798 [Papaver atlanticum]|uniref:Uncharacterized protein n=1 Tax=Papaver atlanticum TaxID=357466 RepID=A0AAD4XYX7_9MAGN|nr:hypothetical protein MKW98_005798 [Papaver atlanticum]